MPLIAVRSWSVLADLSIHSDVASEALYGREDRGPTAPAICAGALRPRDPHARRRDRGHAGRSNDTFSRGHITKAIALIDIHSDRPPPRCVASANWKRSAGMSLRARREPLRLDRRGGRCARRLSRQSQCASRRQHPQRARITHPRAADASQPLLGTSVDQLPQHVACHAMYGHLAMFPIPDVDPRRTG